VTCASGWSQYGENCYLLWYPLFNNGSDQGTWDQCNAYCTASYPGATMLCIKNAAESARAGGFWRWIGYTDMPPYGGGKGTKQFGWVTGCTSSYTNWASGEPNDNNGAYAVVQDKWYDLGPQNKAYCGCQYNPGPTSSPTATPSFSSFQGDVSE